MMTVNDMNRIFLEASIDDNISAYYKRIGKQRESLLTNIQQEAYTTYLSPAQNIVCARAVEFLESSYIYRYQAHIDTGDFPVYLLSFRQLKTLTKYDNSLIIPYMVLDSTINKKDWDFLAYFQHYVEIYKAQQRVRDEQERIRQKKVV